MDDLKDYFDGEIIIVPPVEDEKGKISSTRIRQAILDGDVKEVNHLLGNLPHLRGMVVHEMLVGGLLVIQQPI